MHNHKLAANGLRELPEAVLFEQAQAGCRACLDHLMARHKRLVPFVARRQALGELCYDEAIQAGRIGLWQAIRGYDARKGFAFSSYAYPAIARRIWLAVKRAQRRASPVEAVPPSETPTAADPALVWQARLVQAALHELVERLPQRLRRVIIARYGLAGKPPATFAEIGAQLGRSWERAR